MTIEHFDVAIIGAGVIGSAIADRLSRHDLDIVWFEAEHDVAEGASKANSAIACTGYDMPTGNLESDLARAANPMWEQLTADLDVPYRRVGALALAFDDADTDKLDTVLMKQAAEAGVDAEIVRGRRLRALAGSTAPSAVAAMHVAREGIIDPIRLTIGMARRAVTHGVDLRLNSPVQRFRQDGTGRITHVVTPTDTIAVDLVINAAGVNGDVIAGLAGPETFQMWPRKGEFLLLDRAVGAEVPKILTMVPTEHTRGVLAIPTTNHTVLIGPTATDEEDRSDKTTDAETLDDVWKQATRLVPKMSRTHVIKTFAGLRPAADRTYRIEVSDAVPNLVHAVGIRSTGVSTAPAVAVRVEALVAAVGLELKPSADRAERLPRVPRLAELDDHAAVTAAAASPAHSMVVCACEHVTVAEIQAACTGPVPACSLDGVRKRTRATAGRCQGAYCQVGVGVILSAHTGSERWDVNSNGPGSSWGVGHV